MSEPKAETISFQSHSNTDNYIAAPCISFDNHRKCTSLVKLAKEFLGIPSLSSPIERLFSNVGNFSERCRLSNDRFKQLMFVRCNYYCLTYESFNQYLSSKHYQALLNSLIIISIS